MFVWRDQGKYFSLRFENSLFIIWGLVVDDAKWEAESKALLFKLPPSC